MDIIKYTVGRSPTCDINYTDLTVSRMHAELIRYPDGRVSLRDCNSTQGTYLKQMNGSFKAIKEIWLEPTDTVKFGSTSVPASRLFDLMASKGGADALARSSKVETTRCSYCGHTSLASASFCATCRQSMADSPLEPARQAPFAVLDRNIQYVGFWLRVWASLIDGVIGFILALIVMMSFYGRDLAGLSANDMDGGFVTSYLLPAVYTLIFWITKQATPGKMAVSARIVDAKSGEAPSVGQCIGRYFAYLLSGIPLGLGFLWVAFDARKQGWHDKLAGTVVVRPTNTPVKFRSR